MAYDFSRDALYHAERRPVFVGIDSVDPLDSEPEGFSALNGWWLANLSQLAYREPAEVEHLAAGAGLRLLESYDRHDTQGFLFRRERLAILVFRGTEPDRLRDIATDLEAVPAGFGQARVHAGFLKALDAVWPEVGPDLHRLANEQVGVWFTGHSLGAALAVLAAARRPPRPPGSLYTFGAPRVGDAALAGHLHPIAVERFVNCTDLVTTVPPASRVYGHFGRLRFLTSRGRLLSDPDRSAQRRARNRGRLRYYTSPEWLRRGTVKLRSFADHSIVNYVEGIRRVLHLQLPPGDDV